jgi:hypothetical protein
MCGLSVRVPSRLFRRLVLQMLIADHRLQFFGANAALAPTRSRGDAWTST